jgi:hypothetical protein
MDLVRFLLVFEETGNLISRNGGRGKDFFEFFLNPAHRVPPRMESTQAWRQALPN